MPTWWVEAAQIWHLYGGWFAFTAICVAIIVYYIIWPYFTKVSGGFHKVVCYVDKLYESKVDPTKKDKQGYPILIATNDILSALRENKELLVKNCDASFCPVVLLWKIDFEKIGKDLHEIINLKQEVNEIGVILSTKMCEESCPVFARIGDYLERGEEGDEAIRQEIKASYGRINEFMNEQLAKREAAIEKRDEMLSRAMASLMASGQKNGA